MTKKEAIQFARAYAIGTRDASKKDLAWLDIWYGLDEYDINIEGFKIHHDEENKDQLRILVYKFNRGNPLTVFFTKKGE